MANFFFPQIGEVDLVEAYEFYDEPVLFICRDRTDLLYLAVLLYEDAEREYLEVAVVEVVAGIDDVKSL